jgi:hypothetical protein
MEERQKIGLQINFETKRKISKNGILLYKTFPLTCSIIKTLLLQLIHLETTMNNFRVLFCWDKYVEKEGGLRGGVGNKR